METRKQQFETFFAKICKLNVYSQPTLVFKNERKNNKKKLNKVKVVYIY